MYSLNTDQTSLASLVISINIETTELADQELKSNTFRKHQARKEHLGQGSLSKFFLTSQAPSLPYFCACSLPLKQYS